jgi:hypothetical protein
LTFLFCRKSWAEHVHLEPGIGRLRGLQAAGLQRRRQLVGHRAQPAHAPRVG